MTLFIATGFFSSLFFMIAGMCYAKKKMLPTLAMVLCASIVLGLFASTAYAYGYGILF